MSTVLSWNVASLPALLSKRPSAIFDLVSEHDADVLCIQETKLQEKNVDSVDAKLELDDTWHRYYSCSTAKLGYAGTLLLSRVKPLQVSYGLRNGPSNEPHGRIVTAEYSAVFVVCVYVVNSGAKLENLEHRTNFWDPGLVRHIRELSRHKQVILAGDLNVAPGDIDVYAPAKLNKTAGFTPQERYSYRSGLGTLMLDSFRLLHPKTSVYTYFSYRGAMRSKGSHGLGWRIDLIMLTPGLRECLVDSYVLSEVLGSDHVPIGVHLGTKYF